MPKVCKVTVIDKSCLSENENERSQPSKVTEAVSFSKVPTDGGRSNVILTSDLNNSKTGGTLNPTSYFKRSVVSPQCSVINEDVESSILENSQLANEHGMLLIDIKKSNDAQGIDVSVDCISSTWQPESVKVEKFVFYDLDKDTSIINNVLIEGALDHIIGIESLIQPTEDINQIEKLIGIFKENNDTLYKRLLMDTNTV